jgi:hypothetical protein
LFDRRRKNFYSRIQREREKSFQKLKNEILNTSDLYFTNEEKEQKKRELLNFVQRFVFTNNLKSSLIEESQLIKASYLKDKKFINNFFKIVLLFRSFLSKLPQLRAFLIIACVFFFFFFEYWFHYYTSFSLKNIQITYKDIIEKIPPFC